MISQPADSNACGLDFSPAFKNSRAPLAESPAVREMYKDVGRVKLVCEGPRRALP